MQEFDRIETPENVELERRLAGIGTRFIAGLLDNLIIAGIFIVLYLLAQQGDVWLHKAIDETCGPNAIDCPLEYLDGLPEPEGYAKDWRERVREFHESNRLLTIKVGKLRRRKHRGEDLK